MKRVQASGLLFVALCAHNLEEAFTYDHGRARAAELLRRLRPSACLPSPAAFQGALLAVTLVAGVALAVASGLPRERTSWRLYRAIAAILLANVFVPHVPAAMLLGGYAPGLITALTLNLPVSLWILTRRAEPSRGR